MREVIQAMSAMETYAMLSKLKSRLVKPLLFSLVGILMFMPQLEMHLASPDQFAYLLDGDLWIGFASGGRSRQITSYGDVMWYAWSPDGDRIYYGRRSDLDTESGTYELDFITGAERSITSRVWPIAIMPDGVYMFFATSELIS